MMLQRLATGATGARRPTRGSEALVHACAVFIHSLSIGISSIVYHCVYGRSLALAVQCETTHGVYEFRRGFCTLVLSLVSEATFDRPVVLQVVVVLRWSRKCAKTAHGEICIWLFHSITFERKGFFRKSTPKTNPWLQDAEAARAVTDGHTHTNQIP